MLIQICKERDLESCAELMAAVYAEPPYRESWHLNHAKAYLERFLRIDPSGCYVAFRDDQVLGAVFSFSYPWHNGKLVCIQELFVSKMERKQGIARKLLSCVGNRERVAAWLVVHKLSDASLFYEKMGFSDDGLYVFRHGTINT